MADTVYDCSVMNLSAGGAKVSVGEPLTRGDYVVLTIDRIGRFDADVVWAREETAGIKFREDPQIVAGEISRMLPTIKF